MKKRNRVTAIVIIVILLGWTSLVVPRVKKYIAHERVKTEIVQKWKAEQAHQYASSNLEHNL